MSQPSFLIVRAAPLPEGGRDTVRVAAVQMEPRLGDPEQNVNRCAEAARIAAAEGSALAIFPECALTGYCVSSLDEARSAALPREGSAIRTLEKIALETRVHLVVGYLEHTESGVANAVSVIGPSGVLAHYRKTHLPFLGADRFTEPGTQPFQVYEAAGLRLGLLICYDASFPEASRLLALAGAEFLVLPTNWPEEAEEKASWLPNTRAYENVVYFAAVNRVGEENGFRFHGRSRVCDPTGRTIIQGPSDLEAILVFDVDPSHARQKRIVRREGYWVDRISQRREDLYRLKPTNEIED